MRQQLRRPDAAVAKQLLERARHDPDPEVRRLILDRAGRVAIPEAREALRWHAASDPDPRVALAALERLRLEQAKELGALFDQRLAMTPSDPALLAAHQRWAAHAAGAVLPGFLQQPPPVIDAGASKDSVRVLVIGDFGREGPKQTNVALAAAAYHRQHPFDLGISVGDNFEPDGVLSPADSRWVGGWEKVYDPLGIRFFAATGNHDWGYGDSPAAQILYSDRSRSWRMPALYYSFRAGPAQFFALATQAMSQTQLQWLARELDRSTARWKIIYGHHPVYSYGTYGPVQPYRDQLLAVLRSRADIYLAGHEHSVQHLMPGGRTQYFVGAAAGQDPRPARTGPETRFTDYFLGFTALEIGMESIRVTYVDADGNGRYETVLQRAGP